MAQAEVDEVVLFDAVEDAERVRVTCRYQDQGEIVLARTSEGEVSRWCFEESPHVAQEVLDAGTVRRLERFFGVDGVHELTKALAIAFTGADCFTRIRTLVCELEASENNFEKIA